MRHHIAIALACGLFAVPSFISAQQPKPQVKNISIGQMTNASAGEVDFVGAECKIDGTGNAMPCQFRQVLLRLVEMRTCEVWTTGWENAFTRQSDLRWVSNEGPSGICGVVEITTLEQEKANSPLWTMETRKIVTNKNADQTLCKIPDETPAKYTWRDSTRKLPCEFIRPAAINR
jgi:hypothetical protein